MKTKFCNYKDINKKRKLREKKSLEEWGAFDFFRFAHKLYLKKYKNEWDLNMGGSSLEINRIRDKFYDLFEIAGRHKDAWFKYFQTVDDTKHISIEEIEADVARGELSAELAQQEYWCSFTSGTAATYKANFDTGSPPSVGANVERRWRDIRPQRSFCAFLGRCPPRLPSPAGRGAGGEADVA